MSSKLTIYSQLGAYRQASGVQLPLMIGTFHSISLVPLQGLILQSLSMLM